MKKGLLIGLGVAGLFGLVCCGGFGLMIYWAVAVTGEAVTATDNFLALLRDGKTAEAYRSTAAALQNQQSEAEFTATVKRLGLTDYASASWLNRKVENNEATLDGTVTTSKGTTIPLTVKLAKESGVWKVLSLHGPQAGAGVDELPRDEMARLATDTLLAFDQAVKERDFTAFHGTVSKPLRQGNTPEQLREAFKEFVEKQIDVGGIKDVDPVFAPPPSRDANGQLVLEGHYPVGLRLVKFELKYVREGGAWKLFGIKVNVEPIEG